jgi:hypothetical protein
MKKPLKTAAWSGIITIAISALVIITAVVELVNGVKLIPLWVSPLLSLVSLVFGFLFYNGLLVLAKKFDAKLLKVMVIIGIVMIVVSGIFGFISGIVQMTSTVTALDDGSGIVTDGSVAGTDAENLEIDTTITDEQATAVVALMIILALLVFLLLIASASTILLGVGLLKIKDKVKYARTAAILNIVAGATYIILVGFLISLVAYCYQIAMLFEASKKFEKR